MELATADKKILKVFVSSGKVSLPTFLQQQLKAKEGEIVEIFSDFAEYHKEKPEFSSKLEELEYLSAKSITKIRRKSNWQTSRCTILHDWIKVKVWELADIKNLVS